MTATLAGKSISGVEDCGFVTTKQGTAELISTSRKDKQNRTST